MEKRAGPGLARAHQLLGEAGLVQDPAQAAAERLGVTGRAEQRLAAGSGHVAVAGQVGGHDRRARGHGLEQHDAEGLPAQRGGAEHVGAPHPGGLLVVADAAQPLDPRSSAVRRPQLRRLRALRGDPHGHVLAAAWPTASSSWARPLRGSWRPRKKIVGRSVGSAWPWRSARPPRR